MRPVRLASLLVAAAAVLSCKSAEPRRITIDLTPESADLTVGQTQQFLAVVDGTDNTDVFWSTDDASVATVNSTGLVTAVGNGTTSVVATSSEDPDITKSATVTVTTSVTTLTSGVAVTGISGAASSQRHYKITVPSGATQLSVTTSGSGDLDLFVRRGTQASRTLADCDSESGSASESCVIANPQAGDWYIMLYGYTTYSNATVTATVTGGSTPPANGFTIANSTSSPNVVRGSSTTLTVTATRTGTFTGAIDLTVTGLPTGVTGSFSPATLTSAQTTSTLTLNASASATTGSATITVRANSTGQTERTATATLTVNASAGGAGSITLMPGTTSLTIGRGQQGFLALYTAGNGYTGTGSLKVEGLASGLTAEWMLNADESYSGDGFFQANDYGERVRITVPVSASLGTSSFTVRATPGNTSVSQVTATIQLNIVEPQAVGNAAWTQLVLGPGQACGRRADQKLYCWGGVASMGDGAAGMPRVPAVAGMGRAYTSATRGAVWGCGIEAGTTYCWGSNNGFGFLGNGQASGSDGTLQPVVVSGGHTFTSVSAGSSHTCALTTAGAAYCWGAQFFGALGDGVMATTNSDFKTTPTQVLGGIAFASLSAGTNHTCGLTSAGVAWCWGNNTNGQLGDGTETNRSQPVQVAGGLTFESISAGENITCGVTFSLAD